MTVQNLDATCLKHILKMTRHPEKLPNNVCQLTSVFMLLYHAPQLSILTIQKADTEGYPWRNQMAFPGGHIDRDDASALDAGFRELHEELNITRDQVTYIGTLGHFQTINNKDIQAFLGLWDGTGEICHNSEEISRIIIIPLKTLVDIHIQQGYHGCLPDVFTLRYPYQDVTIWGVTAKILHHFIETCYLHLEDIIA